MLSFSISFHLFLSFPALIQASLFFKSLALVSSVSSSLTTWLMSSSNLFLGLPTLLFDFVSMPRPGFHVAPSFCPSFFISCCSNVIPCPTHYAFSLIGKTSTLIDVVDRCPRLSVGSLVGENFCFVWMDLQPYTFGAPSEVFHHYFQLIQRCGK